MNVVLNTMIIAVHAVKDLIGVMNMNRKECLKAYENLCSALIETDYVECHKCYSYQTHEEELGVFYKLIEEHFDNPPLKFEELEVGMWIWDNLHKTYIHIFTFDIVYDSVKFGLSSSIQIIIETDNDYVVFEPNRFYRKQVEE